MATLADPEQIPVVVLGAGLTGLSAGLELQRLGVPYHVVERDHEAGGHALTSEDDGYRFDRTGHLLHLRDSALRDEVTEWLEGDFETIERRSVVFSHGVHTRYPFQANTLGLPPSVAYECLLGFVQAELARDGNEPRNFEEYCLKHFGAGFSRHFMLPYNERLWGIPAREITTTWCERFVPRPRLEDVLAGAVGLEDPRLGYNARFLYPRRGIGQLARALSRRVRNLVTNSEVTAIDLARRMIWFGATSVRYGALINTAPLPAFLGLLRPLPREIEQARARLRSTPLYYLDVALETPCGKDFHWAYVPEPKYPFYRVGCYSHFSPSMAPAGKANLYVELASRVEPELDTVLPEVVRGLLEMGWLTRPSDVRFARLRKLDPAYVIYDAEREGALGAIEPFLQEHGLISTGRYGAWNYSSMEDALLFGRGAAAKVAATSSAA